MKKNILLMVFTFIASFLIADELHLKKIIKSDHVISFTNQSDSFFCSVYAFGKSLSEKGAYDYYYYNADKSTFKHLYHFENLYFSELFYSSDRKLFLITSEERDYSEPGISLFYKYYLINQNDFSYKPTGKIKFYERKILPSFLRDFYYVHYLYVLIKEYCLIVKDVKERGTQINELHPEKHAYHDMDLVLIDKKGNVCSVLPFTFDDQTAWHREYVELSADGKYIKIYASPGYILGHIDDSLVEKYPELGCGAYYFIYEIVPDNTPYENTEVLNFRYDLEVNEEILIKSEFKNYSAFNVKIKKIINENIKQGIINDSRVRLRTEPNLNCSTILLLEKGDKLSVLSKSDKKQEIGDDWWNSELWYWYQVETSDGKNGWVYGKYLDIENDDME